MNDLALMREERDGARLILRLSGEIDLSNVEHLHDAIKLAVPGSSLVVIDLAEVEYIDSQGLRLLKRLSSALALDGVRLQVLAPPKSIARDVLDLTRMSDEIEVCDTLEG